MTLESVLTSEKGAEDQDISGWAGYSLLSEIHFPGPRLGVPNQSHQVLPHPTSWNDRKEHFL